MGSFHYTASFPKHILKDYLFKMRVFKGQVNDELKQNLVLLRRGGHPSLVSSYEGLMFSQIGSQHRIGLVSVCSIPVLQYFEYYPYLCALSLQERDKMCIFQTPLTIYSCQGTSCCVMSYTLEMLPGGNKAIILDAGKTGNVGAPCIGQEEGLRGPMLCVDIYGDIKTTPPPPW